MSKIIVDGYNLIGIAHQDLKRAREEIIKQLIEYKKKKGYEITLVFDGHIGGLGRETIEYVGGIKIIYSALGERADDVIKKIIQKDKSFWIVISSDKEIEKAAWRENCVAINSETFLDILNGEFYYCERPKGITLSKKQKAIQRVIMKLIC